MSLLPCGWGVAGVVVVAKVVAVTTKGLFVPAKVVTAAAKVFTVSLVANAISGGLGNVP